MGNKINKPPQNASVEKEETFNSREIKPLEATLRPFREIASTPNLPQQTNMVNLLDHGEFCDSYTAQAKTPMY